MDTTNHSCPWCSTSIPVGATVCPKCGAVVEERITTPIPGVTEVDRAGGLGPDQGVLPDTIDPSTWLHAGKEDIVVDHEAIAPPSDAVRLEIRRMELEAEIANAGGAVMSAKGDEARLVGAPSDEAIEALEAGIISAPTAELEQRAEGLKIEGELDHGMKTADQPDPKIEGHTDQ